MTKTLTIRRQWGAVLVGGFCGTTTRYLLSLLIQGWLGKGWPFDILLINLTGALLLACVTTLADATFLIGPTRRLFINVGFLGAYTTFSSLALGDVLLAVGHQWLPAFLYLACSLFGGMGAVLVGDLLGQAILRANKPSGIAREGRQGAKKRTAILPRDETSLPDHIDVDDDLLLPETDEKTRNRFVPLQSNNQRKNSS